MATRGHKTGPSKQLDRSIPPETSLLTANSCAAWPSVSGPMGRAYAFGKPPYKEAEAGETLPQGRGEWRQGCRLRAAETRLHGLGSDPAINSGSGTGSLQRRVS